MAIDLIVFAQTTQNNGYDYVTPAAGEDFFGISGDDLYIQEDAKIIAANFETATTTKANAARFKTKAMADWCEMSEGCLDSGMRFQPRLCGVKVKKGDILNGQIDNLNTNDICSLGLWATKKAGARVSLIPPTDIPEGAIWVRGVFTTACVAITWTNMLTGTWSYNFQRDRNYQILAMRASSASGLWCRLKPKTGSSPEFMASRPGCMAVYELTEMENPPTYFIGANLVFNGLNPPIPQFLATTTDSSQKIDLLILPL